MKKRLAVFLSLFIAAVLTGGVVWGCYADIPQTHYPTNMLNVALYKADLVIEGTIISATPAMQQNYQKQIGNGKCTSYTDYPMTEFTVRVKDVKYGEAPSRKIKIRMGGRPGEITWKPEKGDRVVMMLSCVLDEETGENLWCGCYLTFVITSDGLQALSEGPGKSFNGKTKEELYAYIDEVKSVL